MSTIFLVEDDPLMAECIALSCTQVHPGQPPHVRIFSNAFDTINTIAALSDGTDLPDLVLLDVLLDGPDGFTLLNELISYSDTAAIPVVLVTSLDLQTTNLAHYGVRSILSKESMTPSLISQTVAAYV